LKTSKITNQIYQRLNNSINEKGSASIIVCGGRSPIPLFKELSHLDLAWKKVRVILVDDRLVSSTSPESNERLLKNHLLCNAAKHATYISLKNETKKVLQVATEFDIAILGFGLDGHFASLFPDYIQHEDFFSETAEPKVLYTKKIGSPSVERATMNLSMILRSNKIYVLAGSQEKQDILELAKTDPSLPLFYLLNSTNISYEIID
jgi:6-phosphogluconolactonase|tara:strand:+ start:315 stop:932 length:618 start_codon:yes stop_codon:yes gene_type:complete